MDEELKTKVTNLERDVQELKSSTGFQLKYPLDNETDKILKDTTSDHIFDVVWNDYFYYSTFFESLDGFDVATGGSGATAISGTHIDIATGATGSSSALIQKNPTHQSVLRWDRRARFRTEISLLEITAQEVRISVGDSSNGVQDSHYGFYVEDATLFGTMSFNTTTQAVTLKTLSTSTVYSLEARYFPGERVDFYVDGVLLGSTTSSTAMPSLETTKTFVNLFTFYIENQGAADKKARCSWFEYIQIR